MTGYDIVKAIAVLAAVGFQLVGAPATADADMEAARRFVDDRCGACHVTAPGQPPKHLDAPDFSVIARRYPPSTVAEAFAEGVVTGHPDMPEFELSSEDIDNLVLYLRHFAE